MSDPRPKSPTRATFTFIFITVAIDMLALGVVIPVLPKLIVQLEGGDLARAVTMTGIFGFAWAGMQFFGAPILGLLSDRFGRRPVILISCLGLGLDYILMALAPTVAWLFVGRLISGLTSASYPTAGAYIADVTPPEERAGKFGMLGAAFGLGFIIGPALGGVLGGIDLRLPFWASAGLALLNTAYGFFVLPESLAPANRSAFTWQKANPLGALKLLASTPVLLTLGVSAFLQGLAHESLPSVFVLSMDYRFGWDESTVGFSLAAVGVSTTIVAAVLVGPLTRKVGERAALLVGVVFGALGMFVFGLANAGWMIFAGIIIEAPSGLATPALNSYMSRELGPDSQGQLQGALGSMHGITGMIGPIVFTQVLTWSIQSHVGRGLSGAPFMLAGVLLVFGGIVATHGSREVRA